MKNDTIDSTVIEKKSDTRIQKPSMYNVIYLNDDYTTMEFVIWTLMKFFNKNEDQAVLITQSIHKEEALRDYIQKKLLKQKYMKYKI